MQFLTAVTRAADAPHSFREYLTVLSAHLVTEAAHPDIARFLGSTVYPPQGIVAVSDVIAMGALRALSEFGLVVPDDVRVFGYDGMAIAEQTVQQLSTVSHDPTAGAQHLVDMLLRRIAGEDTLSVVMAPQLIVRVSS